MLLTVLPGFLRLVGLGDSVDGVFVGEVELVSRIGRCLALLRMRVLVGVGNGDLPWEDQIVPVLRWVLDFQDFFLRLS